jgi:hypothetical protein
MRCADFRVFSLRVQGPQPLPPTAQVILPSLRDEPFSLTPPDFACYAYPMVNRQDVPYSHRSPKIGRPLRLAEIIFDGTKLAIERSRPKTTTDGMNCSFRP